MIRRPPRSTLDRSSAASDVYKRQIHKISPKELFEIIENKYNRNFTNELLNEPESVIPVSYTHLRAHETVLDLVCRLLLEKKKNTKVDDLAPSF